MLLTIGFFISAKKQATGVHADICIFSKDSPILEAVYGFLISSTFSMRLLVSC
jgi:hypothetical protein